MLVQTEVERVKFVIRSYIRTRLFKVSLSFALSHSGLTNDFQIEQYAVYICTTPDMHERLSRGELEHAER